MKNFVFLWACLYCLLVFNQVEADIRIAAIAQVKSQLGFSPDEPIFKQGRVPTDDIEVMLYDDSVTYDPETGEFILVDSSIVYLFFAALSGATQGDNQGGVFFMGHENIGLVPLTNQITSYSNSNGVTPTNPIAATPIAVNFINIYSLTYFIFAATPITE